MRGSYTAFLLSIVMFGSLGCGEKSKSGESVKMVTQEQEVKTDIGVLSWLIDFPTKPEKAHWYTANIVAQSSEGIGPSDWGLLARLEFEAVDLKEIVDSAEVSTDIVIPSHFSLNVLFEDEQTNFQARQGEGFYSTELTAYKASIFFKEPLLGGVMYKVDDSSVLVFLNTF